METAVAKMLKSHRRADQGKEACDAHAQPTVCIERLQSEARRIREFLATHSERRSEKGAIRKSNVTDNDSAKMATSKGVIQGYTAVAAVDDRAQIIVAARAHGSGSEQSVLVPMVESTTHLRTDQTLVTADAGYHSEANLQGLYERGVPALIADGLMRRRDARFAAQGRYKVLPEPLYDKAAAGKPSKLKFQPRDFLYDPATRTCICPAGKKLYSTGSACSTHGRKHHKFQGAKRDCLPCQLRDRCLRYPDRTQTR